MGLKSRSKFQCIAPGSKQNDLFSYFEHTLHFFIVEIKIRKTHFFFSYYPLIVDRNIPLNPKTKGVGNIQC